MKKDEALKSAARGILVDALGDVLICGDRDWLSVAEELAEKVAIQIGHRDTETSGLLRMMADLGKRLERAERRLEHYRRKTARRAECARREDPVESAIGDNLDLANMVAFRHNHYELAKSYIRAEARARVALHAQGKGVP